MAVRMMKSSATPGPASPRAVCRAASSTEESFSRSLSSVGFARRSFSWAMLRFICKGTALGAIPLRFSTGAF